LDGIQPDWKTVSYRGIVVRYRDELCGGGNTFGQDFVRLIGGLDAPVRLMDWCCGAGFIGFSLLANGLCEQLVLADINPAAIEACRETIRSNGLEARVRAYVSEGLNSVPEWELFDMGAAPLKGRRSGVQERGRCRGSAASAVVLATCS
jgi:methyltransferase family protein